jgi:hypothetical protein
MNIRGRMIKRKTPPSEEAAFEGFDYLGRLEAYPTD